MPLDGITAYALVDELKQYCIGCKVEKILQPDKDKIYINLYSPEEKLFGKKPKLLISANPSSPRVHFTSENAENPIVAPNFCMLLRKHLLGSQIIDVSQIPFERSLEIIFLSKTELYETVKRRLIVEFIGRGSNVFLTDDNYRIYESIRPIDITCSQRVLIPGAVYQFPDRQNKVLLSEESIESFSLSSNSEVSKQLLDFYIGFSPLLADELSYKAFYDTRYRSDNIINDNYKIKSVLIDLYKEINSKVWYPTVVSDGDRLFDFACYSLSHLGNKFYSFVSLSEMLDYFYSSKDRAEHIKRATAELSSVLNTLTARLSRKLSARQSDLNKSKKADVYRYYGDLINANIGSISERSSYAYLTDYYSENLVSVKVPLDPSLNAVRNAQRYYKLYKKAQKTKEVLEREIPETVSEIEYIKSVFDSLSYVETADDVKMIKDELIASGYIHNSNKHIQNKTRGSLPMEFISSEGARILVGKNNVQNEQLTLKTAGKADIWFHVKNYPSCHVILFNDDKLTDVSIEEAAVLAATYCKSVQDGQKIDVDYTFVKYIKKIPGGKPGMVTYTEFKTAYVAADKKLCEKLRIKK